MYSGQIDEQEAKSRMVQVSIGGELMEFDLWLWTNLEARAYREDATIDQILGDLISAYANGRIDFEREKAVH